MEALLKLTLSTYPLGPSASDCGLAHHCVLICLAEELGWLKLKSSYYWLTNFLVG